MSAKPDFLISAHCFNPSMLRSLLDLEKPLKTLKLGELRDMTAEDYDLFRKLLEKHGPTLTYLQFTICPGDGRTIEMKLPSFPALIHLNICLSSGFPGEETAGLPKISLTFQVGLRFNTMIIFHVYNISSFGQMESTSALRRKYGYNLVPGMRPGSPELNKTSPQSLQIVGSVQWLAIRTHFYV